MKKGKKKEGKRKVFYFNCMFFLIIVHIKHTKLRSADKTQGKKKEKIHHFSHVIQARTALQQLWYKILQFPVFMLNLA